MILILIGIAVANCFETPHLFSDEFVQIINAKQDLWEAGSNFPKETLAEHVINLLGITKDFKFDSLEAIEHANDTDVPEKFDAREKWPFCPSLSRVWDQGACGSCWAVATAEVITDRVCVQSNGSKSFDVSAEDLLSCCTECRYNCSGGNPLKAWEFWIKTGIVSGGAFNSDTGCRPYEIKPCANSIGFRNCDIEASIPTCRKTCAAGFNKTYGENKSFGKRFYQVDTENDLKIELLTNGPVEAVIKVYEDFLCYKSGIYKHVFGREMGLHAVKILGYGVEKGNKYWSAVNSWSSSWGDDGFFKIHRNENDSNIVEIVLAGEPVL